MQLAPDVPIGRPSFELSPDQIATVQDLTCRAAHEARTDVTTGMLEVPITIIVRKAMRRVKKALGLTNLQVRGEHELEDMATHDATLLGRIDITLQFLHQFSDEDAYVAVECKRVGAGLHQLNARYVSEGVHRFATGQYAAGHHWGFVLGYVLILPLEKPIRSIDRRIQKTYGKTSKLTPARGHPHALAVLQGSLPRCSGYNIRLQHIFVDMTCAA
jgi:hypothetical protein